MALNHLPLTTPQVIPLAAAIAAVYDNAANTKAYIRGWRLFNASTTARETVTIAIVPAAAGPVVGTAVTTPGVGLNAVFTYVLQPGESLVEDFPPDGFILVNQHDSVQAVATDANTVTLTLFGAYDA
jgi:hypothetical protein